jgi:methyltransferase (TIGR00027 family)
MEIGQPSRTAFAAARHRATHQLVEGGRIFADPLAVPILGADPDELIRDAADRPTTRRMRAFIAARTRYAEEALAAAVANGTRQLVVLGAGLDTFGCRNPYPELRVFEVDHPDTQAWKRDRLAAAGIAAPASVTFVPVDFERQTLAGALPAAGFDPGASAFFSWLGVVPYLTRAGFDDTIGFVAGLPGGAEVVFDYAQPPEALPAERRAAHQARADRVASIGEPWLTYFDPADLAADLRGRGLIEIEDLGPAQLAARYLGRPDVPADTPGGHVIRAAHSR